VRRTIDAKGNSLDGKQKISGKNLTIFVNTYSKNKNPKFFGEEELCSSWVS
jgi:hypothetical protein